MASASWEHQNEAREALRFIVSDPGYGAPALSNPATMASLLKDLLPDAPREKSVLIAASEAGVAGILSDHVSQGMDLTTASALTIRSFTEKTGYPEEVGAWVVGELAQAMDIAPAGTDFSGGGARGAGQWQNQPWSPDDGQQGSNQPGTVGPGPAQWANAPQGPARAETIAPGAIPSPAGPTGPMGSGPAGPTVWGNQPSGSARGVAPGTYQPSGSARGVAPGTYQPGGQQPYGGYPYTGGQPASPPPGKRRGRTGLVVGISAAVVVIAGVIIAVVALGSKPKPVPVEALSKIIAPAINNSQIANCAHIAPISGLTDVTKSLKCTANSGTISVYLDQFGSAAAYQSGFSRTDTFLGYPSGNHPFCGPTQTNTCQSQWWSNTQKKYARRAGQLLQERNVDHDGKGVATFVWTMPTQQVVIVAQSNTSTLPTIYTWWRHLSYG
jgi:hypothetical protein